MEKILLISTCKEKLHELEFVKPIEDILISENINYFVKHYSKVSEKDLEECSKVIICGTSLKDNLFIGEYHFFDWIKTFKKPVLGICSGMQIIGMCFPKFSWKKNPKGFFRKKTEIGFFNENFSKNFLGLTGEKEVYHLHNNYIQFNNLKDFEVFSESNGIVQAVKHKEKKLYGVLFHPEVRNKSLILEFVKNG